MWKEAWLGNATEEFLYEGQCLENLMLNRRAKITELSKTIHHLNKGKAAGIDHFSGEMLKGGGRSKRGSYTILERNEIKIK